MASDDRGAPRWTPLEGGGLVVCALVFVAIRIPLLTEPGLTLGWHSDAALLGLMARALMAGDIPWLFWGADYLAPLTSLFAAGVAVVMGNPVGPLELRIGVSIEIFAALLFFHAALRRIVGRRAALLSTLWLTAGPAFLFKLGYAPLSAEQYFFLGSAIFWFVVRSDFSRLHHWLVLGLLTGAGFWIHRGVLFVVLPALVVIVLYDVRAIAVRDTIGGFITFAAGAALGYVPAVIGLLAIDQRVYTPVKAEWSIRHIKQRFIETVTYDVWAFIGADSPPLRWILGITIFVLVALAIRALDRRRATMLAAGVVVISIGFWFFSTDANRGAVRYIMIALPIVLAFCAGQIVRAWDRRTIAARVFACLALIVITVSFFAMRFRQVQDVASGALEQHELWPGGFDPRPALSVIDRSRYVVCFADVWIAHKFEFLSRNGTPFVPYRSVNRRAVDSLRRAALPGPKCFVEQDGSVRTLSAAEEARVRRDVLWHIHGWRR